MELLDRYVQAVRKHLPWRRQDDIIAELRANLESQLEDKETELGRPLTKEEAEDWLKQIGSPIQVAARYQRQQYLIGPALFPTYSYVLKLVLTWATAIYAIANAVTIAVGNQGGEAVLRAALRLPWIWIVNAAIVTLIFAAIELLSARFPNRFGTFDPMTNSMAGPMTAQWSPPLICRRLAKATAIGPSRGASRARCLECFQAASFWPTSCWFLPIRSCSLAPACGISILCRINLLPCGGRFTGGWLR
ncbi:MAG: hypothetical protein WDM87_01780 [Terracidiphilus sp.]